MRALFCDTKIACKKSLFATLMSKASTYRQQNVQAIQGLRLDRVGLKASNEAFNRFMFKPLM